MLKSCKGRGGDFRRDIFCSRREGIVTGWAMFSERKGTVISRQEAFDGNRDGNFWRECIMFVLAGRDGNFLARAIFSWREGRVTYDGKKKNVLAGLDGMG